MALHKWRHGPLFGELTTILAAIVVVVLAVIDVWKIIYMVRAIVNSLERERES